MAYLLDTDICIFYLKGQYGLKQKIREAGTQHCFLSEITVLELIYGAARSPRYQQHMEEVAKMRQLFEVIPISTAFNLFAREKARLVQTGTAIPDFDLLIGATAVAGNLIMVTNNEKHMNRIENISIENWTLPAFNRHITGK